MALAFPLDRAVAREDGVDRRDELWRQIAPVLRERRYRGATVKALARACNLAPASLYHHFRSKEELIFFPLQRHAAYCEHAVAAIEQLPNDPKQRLLAYVDIAITLHVDLMLLSELVDEAGLQRRYRPRLVEKYDKARGVISMLVLALRPDLGPSGASDVADRLVALVSGWYASGRPGGVEAVTRMATGEVEALSST